jgi:hypothetical protein
MDSRVEQWGHVKQELSKLSPMLHEETFCKHLIGSVNVPTAYHDDVDEAAEKHKARVLTWDKHLKVGPEELSRKWNIGLVTAKATLDVTTQQGVRTAVHPMSRRLRVDHLHLHRPRLKGTWYLDILIAKVKWLLSNKCANVFTNGKYTKVVPMASQKEAVESLIDFSDDVGIPETLVMDGTIEFTGKHTDFTSGKEKYCKSSSENYCNFRHFLWKFAQKIAPVTLHFPEIFVLKNFTLAQVFFF